jgi:hypothetical protein
MPRPGSVSARSLRTRTALLEPKSVCGMHSISRSHALSADTPKRCLGSWTKQDSFMASQSKAIQGQWPQCMCVQQCFFFLNSYLTPMHACMSAVFTHRHTHAGLQHTQPRTHNHPLPEVFDLEKIKRETSRTLSF